MYVAYRLLGRHPSPASDRAPLFDVGPSRTGNPNPHHWTPLQFLFLFVSRPNEPVT